MATTFDELAKLPASDIQVIDCRSSNNYNGWPEAHKPEADISLVLSTLTQTG